MTTVDLPLLPLGRGTDLASERGVECPGDLPSASDPDLVARAQAACGPPTREPLTSGPLHDAAAVARAGVPTVMVFARTLGGTSHSREEDARDEDLVAAIDAYAALVRDLVA